MDTIDDVLEEFNDDKEYKNILYYNIKNFDVIINNKRSRNSKKRKECSKKRINIIGKFFLILLIFTIFKYFD